MSNELQYPEHNAAYKHGHHVRQHPATTETVTFKFTRLSYILDYLAGLIKYSCLPAFSTWQLDATTPWKWLNGCYIYS